MSLSNNISILNKKAKFEYNLLQRYIAGIQLTGTEIKSIRNNNVSISDSYCVIENSEIWIKKMHIAKYDFGSYNNHLPERDKKLLLKKIEITKIEKLKAIKFSNELANIKNLEKILFDPLTESFFVDSDFLGEIFSDLEKKKTKFIDQ